MQSTTQVKYPNWPKHPIGIIGFMGAGKTTLARELARRLSRPWVDLDQAIEARAGMPVSKFFKENGERAFRKIESEELKKAFRRGAIVALGGGAILRAENRKLLKTGYIIWLHPSWAELWRRLARSDRRSRPLLWDAQKDRPRPESEVRRTWRNRKMLYGRAANIEIRVPKGEKIQTSLRRLCASVPTKRSVLRSK